MGKIGYGYGSEWHLLRYLGYHREYLSRETLKVTGGKSVEWFDFKFSKDSEPLKSDKEFLGLDFINNDQVRKKWKLFWPQTGNSQNWDAVGQIKIDDHDEWLLVEAKGHIREIKSKCGATLPVSKQKIYTALEKTSWAFGSQLKSIESWLEPYYQYANRLAVLYFLMKEATINSRLLFIYFYGENQKNHECPQNMDEWLPAIQIMNDRLGIDKNCELFQRVHYLFLPVIPGEVGVGSF